jgi:hypothetical protein
MHAPLARDIAGSCLLPFARQDHPRAGGEDAAQAAPSAAGRLLVVLADGGHYGRARDAAWAWSQQTRACLVAGTLEHDRALAGFDALCTIWSLADRMHRAWRALEAGDASAAMRLASLARERVEELGDPAETNGRLAERLQARIQALWQIADGLDEADFLAGGRDHEAARDRACATVRQAASHHEAGAISEDELMLVEDLADQRGAQTRWVS